MKKGLLLIFMTALLLGACAKSKAKKNIAGTWNEVKIDDVDVPEGSQDQLIFTEIKGGEGDMSVKDASGVTSETYKYWLEDGGEKLVVQLYGTSGSTVSLKSSRVILELTASTLKINWGSGSYIGTYSK